MIGASRRSDIRIRHSSVRRKHAWFQLTPEGLKLRARPNAPMRDARGRPARALTLPDGGEFTLGRVRLLLVLTDGGGEPDDRERPGDAPDPFDDFSGNYDDRPRDHDDLPPDPDDLFSAQPVLRRGREQDRRGDREY